MRLNYFSIIIIIAVAVGVIFIVIVIKLENAFHLGRIPSLTSAISQLSPVKIEYNIKWISNQKLIYLFSYLSELAGFCALLSYEIVLFPYERVDKDSACRCFANGKHTDVLSDCNYSWLRLCCCCAWVVAWYSRRMFSSDSDSRIVNKKLNEFCYNQFRKKNN